jgi:hypothetical protein
VRKQELIVIQSTGVIDDGSAAEHVARTIRSFELSGLAELYLISDYEAWLRLTTGEFFSLQEKGVTRIS